MDEAGRETFRVREGGFNEGLEMVIEVQSRDGVCIVHLRIA